MRADTRRTRLLSVFGGGRIVELVAASATSELIWVGCWAVADEVGHQGCAGCAGADGSAWRLFGEEQRAWAVERYADEWCNVAADGTAGCA